MGPGWHARGRVAAGEAGATMEARAFQARDVAAADATYDGRFATRR
jgi:hypothetical protein